MIEEKNVDEDKTTNRKKTSTGNKAEWKKRWLGQKVEEKKVDKY